MNQYDVIVVGAGPAGCATAIACAQHGMHVALLERDSFPRHRPGETLHPAIEPLLGQLGILRELTELSGLRHHGHWVHWEGVPRFVEFGGDAAGPWRGFQIERAAFDVRLMNRARALGVRIIQPCASPTIIHDDNRVAGVALGQDRLLAACVVDASGGHGWLRRQLPIQWQAFSPRLIARYGYYQDELERIYDTPRLIAVSNGWQWIARLDTHHLHWTTLSFDSNSMPLAGSPDALKSLTPVGPVRGADVSWRLSEAPMGPGYILVGDAAAILDPASSHGVLKALMSGMQAAQAIADCRAWPSGEHVVHQHFKTWLHNQFNADINALRQFYRVHPYPPMWV
ncbi:NAD(P)/FAD-dependent oxidoreductase [Pseudomonas sp. TMW22091]|uniref:NAD(P)/FAD-dependent oxidoreductase n=1 Tax=Pseudomonas sp. TMW22091 TaxID=2506435 RepID=UPI001F117587|nr:NAD(P)/FAD-dependent oxidoreductase [Pseudomonas sp. TMW22091]MCH4872784.1 NAD(P)/FAD-dependent oxidoreductase [Pseudomonas sp. TMW22091]